MTKRIFALTLFALALPGITAFSQQEGSTPTQALVAFDAKAPVSPTAKDVTPRVDNRPANLLNLAHVRPNGPQVALLIDDGLRTSIGGELNNLRAFITSLPQGTEVFVGFMQNGRVVSANDMPGFTTDRAAAAQSLRIPMGLRGASGSTNITNQDSPYVATAVTDAQRAGVPVYSIYYGDVGRGSFSGQSYLLQVA